MARVIQSGTLAAIVGTEHALYTGTTTEHHQAQIDLSALAAGEKVQVRVYTTLLSGGAEQVFREYRATGVLAAPVLATPILPTDVRYRITVKQLSGTGRSFDWKVMSMAQGRTLSFQAPLQTTLVPTTGTGPDSLTRAGGETVTNYNNAAVNCKPNEARFTGANRVENLLSFPEAFNNAAWFKTNVVVASGFADADGGTGAWKLQEDTTTSSHMLEQVRTLGGGIPIIGAVELKAAERSFARVQIRDETSGDVVFGTVDLSAGTVTTGMTGSITAYGTRIASLGNGWYRVTVWGTLQSTSTSCKFRWYPGTNATTFSYAGTTGSGLYCRQPMFEDARGQVDTTLANAYVSRDVLAFPYHGAGVDGVIYRTTRPDGTTISSGLNGLRLTSDAAKYPLGSNLPDAPMSLQFKWRPTAASQGAITLFESRIDASNATQILHDGTDLIFRVTSGGTAFDAPLTWSYSAGTEYTIGARASLVTGLDVFADATKGVTSSYTQGLKLGTTFQLGGGAQGDYHSVKIWPAALSDSELSVTGSGSGGGSTPPPPPPSNSYNPPYPRLMSYSIGGNKSYESASYSDKLARMHWVVLGTYRNWKTGYSYGGFTGLRALCKLLIDKSNARADVANGVNPVIQIGQYAVLTEEKDNLATSDADRPVMDKLNAMDWWLRNAANQKVQWTSAFGAWDTNFTRWTPADGNGQRFSQWYADYVKGWAFAPTIPEMKIFFCDNVFPQTRTSNTDPDNDGVNQTPSSWASQWREGYRDHFARIRDQLPDVWIVGNTADSNISAYVGEMHGGLLEGAMGESYSLGWSDMMTRYHQSMPNLAEPKLYAFHINTENSTPDLRLGRFGLCSCLMNNGFIYYSLNGNYDDIAWLDEYDNAGAGRGYLGYPIDGPQTAAWSNGVYRRRFDKGWALLNPTGASVTVNLGQQMRKISGAQAPSINDGALVTSVTIGANDGIILLNP